MSETLNFPNQILTNGSIVQKKDSWYTNDKQERQKNAVKPQ